MGLGAIAFNVSQVLVWRSLLLIFASKIMNLS